MPPILVLALWIAFAVWYVRSERKHSGETSFTSWIPTVWMLWSASKPIGRWLNPHGDISEESGSAEDRIFLLGLIAMGCWIISKRRLDWRSRARKSNLLMLLLIYMLISCIWSDTLLSSIKQWFIVFGSAIMSLVVMTEPDPSGVLQRIFARSTYLLITLSVVLIKYYPDLGIEYRAWNGEQFWVGVCLLKNAIGRLCLASGAFVIWSMLVRWKSKDKGWKYQTYVDVMTLVCIVWILKGPGSNYPVTAIVVLVLCAGMFAGLLVTKPSMANSFFPRLTVFIIVLMFALAFMSITGLTPSLGMDKLGRDGTFTGRTDLWQALREIAWSSPIGGLGYGGYWSRHHDIPNVGMYSEGHNGYIDVFLETGLIGITLVLIVATSYGLRVNREKSFDYNWASFKLVFLFILVLHNFTETTLLASAGQLWTGFIFMYMILPERAVRTQNVASGAPAFARI